MMKTSVQLVNTALASAAHNGPDMHQHNMGVLLSGMLDEEELFYVDPASDVDDFGCHYGDGNMDNISVEATSRAIAVGRMPKAESEGSGTETEATSRSSSVYMENSWQASQRNVGYPRMSPEMHALATVVAPAIMVSTSASVITHEGSSLAETPNPVSDPCASILEGLQRAWVELTGQRTCVNPRVEYICRHWASTTSFKTFSSFESDLEVLHGLGVVPGTFTTQISKFREVTTIWGRHAEYEVRVVSGKQQWTCWRRFSNFKVIAAKCVQFDRGCAKAWARVLEAQPTRRCLNREYLAYKCYLLEAFLQQIMFSMATPALLIQFITNDY